MNNEPDYDNLYFEPKAKGTLTEQWKRGELPEGLYYVEYKVGGVYIDEIQQWYNEKGDYYFTDFDFSDCIEQVLAPVPSYQWVIDHSFKPFSQRLFEKTLEDNKKLKELLKKCRPAVEQLIYSAKIYKLDTTQTEELLIKIDEVLNA